MFRFRFGASTLISILTCVDRTCDGYGFLRWLIQIGSELGLQSYQSHAQVDLLLLPPTCAANHASVAVAGAECCEPQLVIGISVLRLGYQLKSWKSKQ